MNIRYRQAPPRRSTPVYSSKPVSSPNYDTWATMESKLTLHPNIIKALAETGLDSTFKLPSLDSNKNTADQLEPPPNYSESNDEEKLRDAKPEDALKIHIKRMHSRISSIQKGFESVRLTVRKFDQKLDIYGGLGAKTQKLEPE